MSFLRPVRFLPHGREGSGLLPWVIAVMIFLCALAGAVSLALNDALEGWSADLKRQISVQIVAENRDEQEQQALRATALLRTVPGITSVRRLSDRELSSLLEPWLGAGNVNDDLPVPAMIEVTLEPDRSLDTMALAAQLVEVAPDARLDDHQQWIGRLLDLTGMIRLISLSVVAMIVLTTIAIVAFGTRAGLASHRDSVRIMHLMGAEDAVIAGEFQYRYLRHGLIGGVVGLLIALMALIGLSRLVIELGGGLLPELSLAFVDYLVLLLLPLGAGLLTMLTARFTVTRELARIL